jgi:DNA polymerase delta subunit 2
MAVLGMETSSGDFEVVDLCFAGLPELYKAPGDVNGTGHGKVKGKGKGKGKAEGMDVDGELSDPC